MCSVPFCAILCHSVPFCAILCCAVLCCAILCCAVLCCATMCHDVPLFLSVFFSDMAFSLRWSTFSKLRKGLFFQKFRKYKSSTTSSLYQQKMIFLVEVCHYPTLCPLGTIPRDRGSRIGFPRVPLCMGFLHSVGNDSDSYEEVLFFGAKYLFPAKKSSMSPVKYVVRTAITCYYWIPMKDQVP